MEALIDTFHSFFNYTYAQYALISTVLISLMCGILSPLVVYKQRSYLGETLAHLVFPGIVIGYLISENQIFPFWPSLIISAAVTGLLGTYLLEWLLRRLHIPPDSGAVLCLSAFFSLGIIQIAHMRGTRIDPEKLLFGDVLTLEQTDLIVLAIATLVIFSFVYFLKKHWNAWVSDPEFAQIVGFRIELLERIFPFLMTLAVLTGIFTVGGLMISSLLTIPALIVQPSQIFSPRTIMMSVFIGVLGVFMAFVMDWPVGATLVLIGFAFVISKALLCKKN